MPEIQISSALKAALSFVEIGCESGKVLHFPDFMLIGPQRTGTTWLQRNLTFHPEVFMARPKELHYFNTLAQDYRGKHHNSRDLCWYCSHFELNVENYAKRLLWNWRDSRRPRLSDFNYRSFSTPKIRGEATASYAVLEPPLINEITLLNPAMKAILFIRHPVDRAWSHAKKELLTERSCKLNEVSFAEFRAVYTHPYHVKCARFINSIDNWSTYLRPDHLFIAFFDEIQHQPAELLRKIFRFLEVDDAPRHLENGHVHSIINPTSKAKIPPQHREFLEQLFREQIQALNDRYNLGWH